MRHFFVGRLKKQFQSTEKQTVRVMLQFQPPCFSLDYKNTHRGPRCENGILWFEEGRKKKRFTLDTLQKAAEQRFTGRQVPGDARCWSWTQTTWHYIALITPPVWWGPGLLITVCLSCFLFHHHSQKPHFSHCAHGGRLHWYRHYLHARWSLKK